MSYTCKRCIVSDVLSQYHREEKKIPKYEDRRHQTACGALTTHVFGAEPGFAVASEGRLQNREQLQQAEIAYISIFLVFFEDLQGGRERESRLKIRVCPKEQPKKREGGLRRPGLEPGPRQWQCPIIPLDYRRCWVIPPRAEERERTALGCEPWVRS